LRGKLATLIKKLELQLSQKFDVVSSHCKKLEVYTSELCDINLQISERNSKLRDKLAVARKVRITTFSEVRRYFIPIVRSCKFISLNC